MGDKTIYKYFMSVRLRGLRIVITKINFICTIKNLKIGQFYLFISLNVEFN